MGQEICTAEIRVPSKAAIDHLCGIVKYATVSSEQDDMVDWGQFSGLHEYLKETYPLVHQTLTREIISKASLLYKWSGKGKGQPFALLAHMDVVPVEHPEAWKVPPFSGYFDGEYVWGRGSADMKCQLIAIMEVIESLIEEGFVPNQDVYLCFGHNEEVMSKSSGAQAIADELARRGVTLEFVVDEAGAIMLDPPFGIQRTVAMVGMAEKGFANISVLIRGEGGHSAEPQGSSAMQKTCRFVTALEQDPMPYRLIPTVKAYIESLMSALPEWEREKLSRNKEEMYQKMAEDKKCHAMLRTTVVPTIFRSGQVFNSIPSQAEIVLNARLLPGDTAEDVCKHVESLLCKCGIDDYVITIDKASQPPIETPKHTPTYEILRANYSEWNPEFIVTPYLVTGGTDSKHYVGVTDQIYRVSASLTAKGKPSGAHGDNEHVAVSTLGNAQWFMKSFLLKQSARFDD